MEDFKAIHQAPQLMQAWAERHAAIKVQLQVRTPIIDPPTEFDEVMDDYDGGWRKQAFLRTDSETARIEYDKIAALVMFAGFRHQAHHEQRRQQLLAWGYSEAVVDTVPFVGVK